MSAGAYACDICGATLDDDHALFGFGFLTDQTGGPSVVPGVRTTGQFTLIVTCGRDRDCRRSPRIMRLDDFDRRSKRRMVRTHKRAMRRAFKLSEASTGPS